MNLGIKILIGFGVFLAVIVVSFLMAGWFQPKLEFRVNLSVHKPVEQTFKGFMDPGLMKSSMTGLDSVGLVSGEFGKTGGKFRLYFDEDGKKMIVDEEVLEVKENESFKFFMDNKVLSGTGEFRFATKDSTTQVTYINDVKGKNVFWRSMLAFFHSSIKERNQQNLNKLRVLIEGQ